MAGIIQLLPDHVSNQIAAGEVIQRPASAVKELLENAIDAGSTSIQLIIKDAGKTRIQVIDNGCGMNEIDARMCFEKHATSKIKNIDDLFQIHTKGFRGEALASIAAVAQVELKTRRAEEELGTHLFIEDSKIQKQEACSAPVGTSFTMKNLFYNVPARRNFLKSDAVEIRHILDEFERLALAYPEIHFTLHNNDTEVYHLKKENLRQRICSIFGANYNDKLVPVLEESDIIKIHGFVGKPTHTKRTRGEQFIFVNDRFIKSAYLNHAIMQAYESMIQKDTHPLYVLFIDINPSMIDINVHPTKQEIKFEDERLVYGFIHSGVRHALSQFGLTPTLDFSQDSTINNFDSFIKPHFNQAQNAEKVETTNDSSIKVNRPFVHITSNKKDVLDSLFLLENIKQTSEHFSVIPSAENSEVELFGSTKTQAKKAFQIHKKYVVFQIKSGFILIDQQAAHERILFEQYRNVLSTGRLSSQRLLFPVQLDFSVADAAILQEILADLSQLGFEIESFGGNTFIIHAIPAELGQKGNERSTVEHFIEMQKNMHDNDAEKRKESVAISMAICTSMKTGDILQEEEMNTLIDELFGCTEPYISPSRKRTFVTYSFQDILSKFEQ